MPIRVIATCNKNLGSAGELTDEEEFISDNEDLKNLLVYYGWAKPYDDTKPRPKKGLWLYEEMVHQPETFVVKNNALYQSKSGNPTSATWIPTEWIAIG